MKNEIQVPHNEISKKLFPNLTAWKEPKNFIKKLLENEQNENYFLPTSVDEGQIPAGYTYLGQFIAHDLTFSSSNFLTGSQQTVDNNFRTPQLDLDSMYGSGPEISPIYYDQDRYKGLTHFKVSKEMRKNPAATESPWVLDLNRMKAGPKHLPLIPDLRNDENIFISQIHLIFQLLHNKIIDQKLASIEQQIDANKLAFNAALAQFGPKFKKRIQAHTSSNRHGHSQRALKPKSGKDIDFSSYNKNLDQALTQALQSINVVYGQIRKALEKAPPNRQSSTTKESIAYESIRAVNFPKALLNQEKITTKNIPLFLDTISQYLDTQAPDFIHHQSLNKRKQTEQTEQSKPTDTFLEVIQNFRQLLHQVKSIKNQLESNISLLLLEKFQETKQEVTLIYQSILINDYLSQILRQDAKETVLKYIQTRKKEDPSTPVGQLLPFFRWGFNSYIPLEFSVALFRFGHSMVRDNYQLSPGGPTLPIFDFKRGDEKNTEHAIYWPSFFPERYQTVTDTRRKPTEDGKIKVFPSGKLDIGMAESMLNDLGKTNEDESKNIVIRNLRRAIIAGLPSGNEVARTVFKCYYQSSNYLSWEPLDAKTINKELASDILFSRKFKENFPQLKEVDSDKNKVFSQFLDDLPLWIYILIEAKIYNKKENQAKLGPMASLLIMEVFVGLLLSDKDSILYQEDWKTDFQLEETSENSQITEKKSWTMVKLLKYLGLYREID